MRPAEYTEDQIIEAGKQLLANGRRVTGFALRKIVGGGDQKRLAGLWEAYQQQQEVVESEPVQDLPVEVEETLNEMTSSFLEQVRHLALNLNNRAVKTAERRVADVMRTTQDQQEQAEAELRDAAETVDDLESHLAALQEELWSEKEELTNKITEMKQLQKNLEELRKDNAVLSEKLNSEQEQRKASEEGTAKLREQLVELKQDKTDLRKERDLSLKQIADKDKGLEALKQAAARTELAEAQRESLEKQLEQLVNRVSVMGSDTKS